MGVWDEANVTCLKVQKKITKKKSLRIPENYAEIRTVRPPNADLQQLVGAQRAADPYKMRNVSTVLATLGNRRPASTKLSQSN
jgi:hypothetical protein